MDNIIISRVILFAVVIVHTFIGYGGPAVFTKHINAKLYDTLFAIEILALTSYIVYDNILSPPHDGWVLAIVGYIIVYGVVVLSWLVFASLTIDPKKVYQLNKIEYSNRKVRVFDKGNVQIHEFDVVEGTIREGWREFAVVLLEDAMEIEETQEETIYVQFKAMQRNGAILVKRHKDIAKFGGMSCC